MSTPPSSPWASAGALNANASAFVPSWQAPPPLPPPEDTAHLASIYADDFSPIPYASPNFEAFPAFVPDALSVASDGAASPFSSPLSPSVPLPDTPPTPSTFPLSVSSPPPTTPTPQESPNELFANSLKTYTPPSRKKAPKIIERNAHKATKATQGSESLRETPDSSTLGPQVAKSSFKSSEPHLQRPQQDEKNQASNVAEKTPSTVPPPTRTFADVLKSPNPSASPSPPSSINVEKSVHATNDTTLSKQEPNPKSAPKNSSSPISSAPTKAPPSSTSPVKTVEKPRGVLRVDASLLPKPPTPNNPSITCFLCLPCKSLPSLK